MSEVNDFGDLEATIYRDQRCCGTNLQIRTQPAMTYALRWLQLYPPWIVGFGCILCW